MMGTQQHIAMLFKDPDQEDDLFDEENTLVLLDKQLAAQGVPVKDRASQIEILKWERRNVAVEGGAAGKVSKESVRDVVLASGVEGERLGSVGAVVCGGSVSGVSASSLPTPSRKFMVGKTTTGTLLQTPGEPRVHHGA